MHAATASPSRAITPRLRQAGETLDRVLALLDNARRVLGGHYDATRPNPAGTLEDATMLPEERRLSGAYMRVNHVGEICAQALYVGQALSATSEDERDMLLAAAQEEADHLQWCHERLDELGERVSHLNPLWYAGSALLGIAAGAASRKLGLGFVVETERQVERHLDGHLQNLPAGDRRSRAIITQMRTDESRHADRAETLGAMRLPLPVPQLMRAAAKLMTTVAHRV